MYIPKWMWFKLSINVNTIYTVVMKVEYSELYQDPAFGSCFAI